MTLLRFKVATTFRSSLYSPTFIWLGWENTMSIWISQRISASNIQKKYCIILSQWGGLDQPKKHSWAPGLVCQGSTDVLVWGSTQSGKWKIYCSPGMSPACGIAVYAECWPRISPVMLESFLVFGMLQISVDVWHESIQIDTHWMLTSVWSSWHLFLSGMPRLSIFIFRFQPWHFVLNLNMRSFGMLR